MRIIDAHVHLWDVDGVPIPWFRDDLGLPRRATPETLADAGRGSGVSAAVAVQAADSVAEAAWLTGIAEKDPLVRRAVLQYVPTPGPPLESTAAMLGPSVAGIRAAVPQFAADLSDVAGLDALAAALGDSGHVLELLLRPGQLPGAAALAHRHPGTAIVVCHLGLAVASPDQDWLRDLRAFAAEANAHAKISGLVHPARPPGEFRGMLAAAVDAFGAHRLLHGSDWPMSTRTLSYAEVQGRVADALPAVSSADAEALWAGTAARLYRL